jgi:Na+-driven multidrug efflux pump
MATGTDRPKTRDWLLAAATVVFVVGSLVTMVAVVTGAERPLYVLIVEPITWTAATIGVGWILWRQTWWGRDE